jgi:hypothetical protein
MFGLDFLSFIKDTKLANCAAKIQQYMLFFSFFLPCTMVLSKKLPDHCGFVPRENVICELF